MAGNGTRYLQWFLHELTWGVSSRCGLSPPPGSNPGPEKRYRAGIKPSQSPLHTTITTYVFPATVKINLFSFSSAVSHGPIAVFGLVS